MASTGRLLRISSVKDLSWDDIKLVKSVADAKGLAGAAAQLGLNHSTVFRRLGALEQALAVPLFERHRGGYTLTAAGEEMLALGTRMDNDVTALMRKLDGREPSPAGDLRVTTSDTLLVHLLTPMFARFRSAYPDVRLDLVIGNLPLNLSKRDADVAVRATDNPPETLVGRRIARIAWALYGRATAGSPETGPSEQRRWVALGENFANFWVARRVREQAAPDEVVYRVNTVLGLAEAVESGIGVGFLPCFIADPRPGLVRLQSPDPLFSADLWLLTHPDLRHAPRVRAFLDFMAGEILRQRPLIEGAGLAGEYADTAGRISATADQAG